MVASPAGEIRVTAGTLPRAPTTALMTGPTAVVTWNWTAGQPGDRGRDHEGVGGHSQCASRALLTGSRQALRIGPKG
jgi:hypothetical protein